MPDKIYSSDPLELLTPKQSEALELLVKHKTSKEISRILGISPHTVDQRIESAKRKLNVSTRGDLVQAYLSLKRVCHQLTYEESQIDADNIRFEPLEPDALKSPSPFFDPKRFKPDAVQDEESDHRVGPAFLDGNAGGLYRFLVILGIAGIILLIILVTVSVYLDLSELVKQ